MTLLQRRFFLFFFALLFVTTAPIIVLFAKGYRFDSHGKIFIYSGSVTVKSWPRDVDIYINNKKQEKKKVNVINSSYTINGIRPGKYVVRCEKDGYTSWIKNIEIHSGISTEMWNILLFPVENMEIKRFSPGNITQFFLSPRDKDEVVFFSKDGDKNIVSVFDAGENKHEQIYQTDSLDFLSPEEKENIEWSSDNKQILIPFQKDGQKVFIIARIKKEDLRDIIDLNSIFAEEIERREKQKAPGAPLTPMRSQPEQKEINKLESGNIENSSGPDDNSAKQFKKVRWMFDKNDELVILNNDHELYYINIEKPEEMILIDDQVSGFDFAGNRIYYTQLPNNIVWEIKSNDVRTKHQITNTVITSEEDDFVELMAYDQYRIAIITQERDLYVYNHEKEKAEISMDKIISGARDIQFSDDGKKLLYWTTNEIWCLMLREWKVQPIREKGDRLFITRLSKPIKNVQWMDNYENLLFSVGNTVKSASLDTRSHAYIVDVMELKNDIGEREMFYNKTSQRLFMITKQNENSSLQSALLIDKTGFLGL
ncbi:MAG: hypothetical protein U9M90_01040 [Patescibacteria group bacterium]|nr:hypothetical protein [Patescibacteria group bacterium]